MSHLVPSQILDAKRKRLLSGSAKLCGRTIVHLRIQLFGLAFYLDRHVPKLRRFERLATAVRTMSILRISFLLGEKSDPLETC
jgi:hypothetical protein